jgi:thymidylate kinase
VIGPDGAGKSTLIDRLEAELPYRPKRIYMGINPDATTHALPTTRLVWFVKRRLGRPMHIRQIDRGDAEPVRTVPASPLKRVLREIKSALFVANRIAEQWYRQAVCWAYQWRGHLVLIDRHFYLDYLANRFTAAEARPVMAWRVHDFLMDRLYPRPNLTLYLDAAPEVLFARKPEATLDHLRRLREAYQRIRGHVPCFEAIDASQDMAAVYGDARQHIAALVE